MDYYDILNVSKYATSDDIKKSYNILIRRSKKDKNIKKMLEQINKAYSVLKDPLQRIEYNRIIDQDNINSHDLLFKKYYHNEISESDFSKKIFDEKNPNLPVNELIIKRTQEDIENINDIREKTDLNNIDKFNEEFEHFKNHEKPNKVNFECSNETDIPSNMSNYNDIKINKVDNQTEYKLNEYKNEYNNLVKNKNYDEIINIRNKELEILNTINKNN